MKSWRVMRPEHLLANSSKRTSSFGPTLSVYMNIWLKLAKSETIALKLPVSNFVIKSSEPYKRSPFSLCMPFQEGKVLHFVDNLHIGCGHSWVGLAEALVHEIAYLFVHLLHGERLFTQS